MSVGFSLGLYSINIKTAKPISPKLSVVTHMIPVIVLASRLPQ